MSVGPGTRLGQYEVVSVLGAGGMGVVYRARDTRLHREVAIKVLPETVAQDAERLARFEREARMLASLNHANIATLHGFESEQATRFLVMELVDGETLADRIARGPIPVDETIALFLQIAEGLEAAHEKGVVHRDLKPANIKASTAGKVKILDFGLAKALVPDVVDTPAGAALSRSPTVTLAATMRGEILGTAAYMSPEQAKGAAVDTRTDLWAFGVCAAVVVPPSGGDLAITPDGQTVVYGVAGSLYVRRVDQLQGATLPGTETGGTPFGRPTVRGWDSSPPAP